MTQTNDTSPHELNSRRVITSAALPQRRKTIVWRGLTRSRMLEPESLTDARARIDARAAVGPHARARRLVLGVPLAMLLCDITAVTVQSVVVGGPVSRLVVFAVLVLLVRGALHQYRPRLSLSLLDDLPRGIGATLAAFGLTIGVEALMGWDVPEHESLDRAVVFFATAVVLQACALMVLRQVRQRRAAGRRTLIIGSGRVATTLTAALREHRDLGLDPVGFADPDRVLPPGERVLATDMAVLPRVIVEHEIDTVVLAFRDTGDAYVDTIMAVHQTGCSILLVPSMFELHHDGPDVERVRGIPLMRLRPDPTLRPSWWIKRGFDMLCGALALIVLAVPLAIVALGTLLDSGRPILFWQERIGLDGEPFWLCKFRSMRPESEHESATNWTIDGDPRVSRFGRLIRRTSIDELPQLWNILRGQMSLVGPRPERPTFVRQFAAEHERYWARHRVPVGLTGLAQVNGLRGDTSIRERARYDNYYIANWSLWLDAKVLLLTVREVLGGRGR